MIVVTLHVWKLGKIVQDEDRTFEISRSCSSSRWKKKSNRRNFTYIPRILVLSTFFFIYQPMHN